MKTSDNGVKLIEDFEGFSGVVYSDLAGNPTIGYGHKLLQNEDYASITQDEATALLQNDLHHVEVALSNSGIELNQNQFDALASFAFNLGVAALLGSTLMRLLRQGDYAGAQDQFQRWDHVGGVQSAGLLRRRLAEAQLFGAAI